MYTLFISTYDKLINISLLKNGKTLNVLEEISKQNHSILVMPMIDNILKKNNITTNDLNEIIVVNGPGSFTGVRIGVVIAKTLAYSLNIPIKTITSLECILVSYKSINNKLATISDTKGKYVGYFNKDNEKIEEFKYLKSDEYQEYINDKKEYLINDNKFDIESIYNY